MFENHKLSVKGRIVQIISDKDFNSYFSYDKKGKRVNALSIQQPTIKPKGNFWNNVWIIFKDAFTLQKNSEYFFQGQK